MRSRFQCLFPKRIARKLRSARHNISGWRAETTSLANVISPLRKGTGWAANRMCVLFSNSETNRNCGYASSPREATGNPNTSRFAPSSGTSRVDPSSATSRRSPYQAPRLRVSAQGKPSKSFQHTAQAFPVGHLHEDRQGNYAGNNQISRLV